MLASRRRLCSVADALLVAVMLVCAGLGQDVLSSSHTYASPTPDVLDNGGVELVLQRKLSFEALRNILGHVGDDASSSPSSVVNRIKGSGSNAVCLEMSKKNGPLVIAAGSRLELSSLVLENTQLKKLQEPPVLFLQEISRKGVHKLRQPEGFLNFTCFSVAVGAKLALSNVTVHTSCSTVAEYAKYACNGGWSENLQVVQHAVVISKYTSPWLEAQNITLTCRHTVQGPRTSAFATADSIDAQAKHEGALLTQGEEQLLDMAAKCQARAVSTAGELHSHLTQNNPSAELVVAVVLNDLTLSPTAGFSGSTVTDKYEQVPCKVSPCKTSWLPVDVRNVVVLEGASGRQVVLDVQSQRDLFQVYPSGHLVLTHLTLLNMPLGPPNWQPTSWFLHRAWFANCIIAADDTPASGDAIVMSRTQHSPISLSADAGVPKTEPGKAANGSSLIPADQPPLHCYLLQNVTVELPYDYMEYVLMLHGKLLSPVPHISRTEQWFRIVTHTAQLKDAGDTFLHYAVLGDVRGYLLDSRLSRQQPRPQQRINATGISAFSQQAELHFPQMKIVDGPSDLVPAISAAHNPRKDMVFEHSDFALVMTARHLRLADSPWPAGGLTLNLSCVISGWAGLTVLDFDGLPPGALQLAPSVTLHLTQVVLVNLPCGGTFPGVASSSSASLLALLASSLAVVSWHRSLVPPPLTLSHVIMVVPHAEALLMKHANISATHQVYHSRHTQPTPHPAPHPHGSESLNLATTLGYDWSQLALVSEQALYDICALRACHSSVADVSADAASGTAGQSPDPVLDESLFAGDAELVATAWPAALAVIRSMYRDSLEKGKGSSAEAGATDGSNLDSNEGLRAARWQLSQGVRCSASFQQLESAVHVGRGVDVSVESCEAGGGGFWASDWVKVMVTAAALVACLLGLHLAHKAQRQQHRQDHLQAASPRRSVDISISECVPPTTDPTGAPLKALTPGNASTNTTDSGCKSAPAPSLSDIFEDHLRRVPLLRATYNGSADLRSPRSRRNGYLSTESSFTDGTTSPGMMAGLSPQGSVTRCDSAAAVNQGGHSKAPPLVITPRQSNTSLSGQGAGNLVSAGYASLDGDKANADSTPPLDPVGIWDAAPSPRGSTSSATAKSPPPEAAAPALPAAMQPPAAPGVSGLFPTSIPGTPRISTIATARASRSSQISYAPFDESTSYTVCSSVINRNSATPGSCTPLQDAAAQHMTPCGSVQAPPHNTPANAADAMSAFNRPRGSGGSAGSHQSRSSQRSQQRSVSSLPPTDMLLTTSPVVSSQSQMGVLELCPCPEVTVSGSGVEGSGSRLRCGDSAMGHSGQGSLSAGRESGVSSDKCSSAELETLLLGRSDPNSGNHVSVHMRLALCKEEDSEGLLSESLNSLGMRPACLRVRVDDPPLAAQLPALQEPAPKAADESAFEAVNSFGVCPVKVLPPGAELPRVCSPRAEGLRPGNANAMSRGAAGGFVGAMDAPRLVAQSSVESLLSQSLSEDPTQMVKLGIDMAVGEHARRVSDIYDRPLVLHEELANGGFGKVYRGTWRGLTVAVKVLVLDGADAFRHQSAVQEVALLVNMVHRNVVTTYTYELQQQAKGQVSPQNSSSQPSPLGRRPCTSQPLPRSSCQEADPCKLYIVQEYCSGGTLRAAVDNGLLGAGTSAPSLPDILLAALDVAEGLCYVHSKGVVHGDLNPNNVLLCSDPQSSFQYVLKVADFGLSVTLEAGQTHVSSSHARGTMFYIAPEVMESGHISKAADVFALGVVLWELYHGRPPWRVKKTPKVVDPSVLLSYSPLCPLPYKQLCQWCMSRQPHQRPSADELAYRIVTMLDCIPR